MVKNMKKIINFILTVSMLLNYSGMSAVVYAQTQQQYQMSEAKINGKEGLIYYYPEEKREYFVYSEGNKVITLDLETREELVTLTVSDVNEDISMKSVSQTKFNQFNKNSHAGTRYSDLFLMYDKWSREPKEGEFAFKRQLSFTLVENLAVSAITTTLIYYLTNAGLFTSLAPTIATFVHDFLVQDIEIEVYQMNNLHCEILVKRKGYYYGLVKNQNGYVVDRDFIASDSDYNAHWLGSPWDYAAYPNACRVLTEKY